MSDKNNRKSAVSNVDSKIQMKIREEEANVFRNERARRYVMEHRSGILVILCIVTICTYLISLILPNSVLSENNHYLSLAWYMSIIRKNAGTIGMWLGGGETTAASFLITQYLIVGIVGAALAVSGAIYQGSFRNALASPTTLGIQTGGVLGGTVYVMCIMEIGTENVLLSDLQQTGLLQRYALTISIMIGCFVVVGAVFLVSRITGHGKSSSVMLVIAGTVFSGGIGEVLGLVQYRLLLTDVYSDKATILRYMMMGTFSKVFTPEHLAMIGIPLLTGIAAMICMGRRLNLLVFGEDEARTMGINVNREKFFMVAVVTVLTAVVISFCGMIGFMGFIVPHLARRIIGPDFRYLIPASALLGAICMMVIFHVAMAVEQSENINFMTSLLGGTIFLIMVIRFRSKSNADWA